LFLLLSDLHDKPADWIAKSAKAAEIEPRKVLLGIKFLFNLL
jgi:hypothetical protein